MKLGRIASKPFETVYVDLAFPDSYLHVCEEKELKVVKMETRKSGAVVGKCNICCKLFVDRKSRRFPESIPPKRVRK